MNFLKAKAQREKDCAVQLPLYNKKEAYELTGSDGLERSNAEMIINKSLKYEYSVSLIEWKNICPAYQRFGQKV